MKNLIAITAIATLAVGCATRPESIHASHVSHEKYTHLECVQLSEKLVTTREELKKFSSMQDTKANVDALGVFFVLIPFSKLTGDHEGDIARLKGEVEAIETAQIKAKCKSL